MLLNLSDCTPLLAAELENLIRDGDTIRLLEIIFDLTDLGNQQDLLTPEDRAQLSLLNHLVGAVAREQCKARPIQISS